MAIYKRSEGGITYFTPKEVKSRFTLTAAQRKTLPVEVVEQMMALVPEADQGEEVSGLETLGMMTDTIEFLNPKVTQTKAAREAEAILLLKDGETIDAVRKAAKVSYRILRSWVEEVDDKGKKTGVIHVSERIYKKLLEEEAKVTAENEEKKRKAEERKAAAVQSS